VCAVAVAPLSTTGEFVTAVQDGNNDLDVIAWRNNTNTRSITRLASFTAGALGVPSAQFAAQYVAVTGIGNNRFVIAPMSTSGLLQLTTFQLNSNGSISQLGTATGAFPITVLAITQLDSQRVVTVTANGLYNATVTTWLVNSNGSISQQATWIVLTSGCGGKQ